MQIQVDIPEDLVDFIDKKAKQKTIPVKHYAQMVVVDFFRDRKADEEFELEERNRPEIDETLTDEEIKEMEERRLRREKRADREEKIVECTIEALQTFTEFMVAYTDAVQSIKRVSDGIYTEINNQKAGN